jgi:hypothetical protein
MSWGKSANEYIKMLKAIIKELKQKERFLRKPFLFT